MFGTSKRLRVCLGIWTPIRSAQVGYVRTAGSEAARFHVQINLIAHNGVENQATFRRSSQKRVNSKNCLPNICLLGTQAEEALFALFLASDQSNFFVGQAIPFFGGWVNNERARQVGGL